MPVEFHFEHLDPTSFQRLINALLTARFGEAIRILPLRGRDGGRDAETASGVYAPIEFILDSTDGIDPIIFRPGRYLFQVKHHRTSDSPIAPVRSTVAADFEDELTRNVLTRTDGTEVDFFFLVTNVPGSGDAVSKIDEKRRQLLQGSTLHADVLWQSHVVSWLDQLPSVWHSFPELFAGMQIPLLSQVAQARPVGLPKSLRIALTSQFQRDGVVRFRQINLEQNLARLFIDLDASVDGLKQVDHSRLIATRSVVRPARARDSALSCINILLAEGVGGTRKLLLQGGPGQGKSTINQMLAQLYRASLLQRTNEYRRVVPLVPKARLPLRIELRLFAEWLGTTDRSIEQFLAEMFSKDAGGSEIAVQDIQAAAETTPLMLICDGLDEVGSDDLRDLVIAKINECVARFEASADADVRVIIASRPPAIAGRANQLVGFASARLADLTRKKVDEYVQNWAAVQCNDARDRERVISAFEKRRNEVHVEALVTNPMQLSVLLHLIRLKGEAFPDRRAELYREYFKTVIDRDVEKSPELLRHRDDIEALHEVNGFEIHRRAETDRARSSLTRAELLEIVRAWLSSQNRRHDVADALFKIGEERLGLIVALRGEGEDTRYGFEVQPVREYFAAAFINDKCEGDAHEIFQAMVRRPFWREVALFLAGLRRANERADLLSRTRALDDDVAQGWRQDGCDIVLRLLQEGVFTSPGHVHQDAVAFLLRTSDASIEKARRVPIEIASLPAFVKACDSPQHVQLLQELLKGVKHSSDRHAAARLYAVANKVLKAEVLFPLIADFSSPSSRLAAQVKLLWPAMDGLNITTMAREHAFFPDVPNSVWAASWFLACSYSAEISTLPNTSSYHELLFEQFAFQWLNKKRFADNVPVPGQSAIWVLCFYLAEMSKIMGSSEPIEPATVCTGRVDYSGLSGPVKDFVKAVVEGLEVAIESHGKGRSLSRSLVGLFEVIERGLDTDGLVGWMACRCATSLMEEIDVTYHERALYRRVSIRESVRRSEPWIRLRRLLTPYFRTAIPIDLDSSGRTFTIRILRLGLHKSRPSHVRVNGEFQSVPRVLSDAILGLKALPFSWLDHVPIPAYWSGEIVDGRDDSQVTTCLAALAEQCAMMRPPTVTMDLHQMRRILSIVRKSDDAKVAAGALLVLLDSRFINCTSKQIALRMISADSLYSDISERLFRSDARYQDPQVLRKIGLAEAIVRGEARVSQGCGAAAAAFLADNVKSLATPLPPLESFRKTV